MRCKNCLGVLELNRLLDVSKKNHVFFRAEVIHTTLAFNTSKTYLITYFSHIATPTICSKELCG